MPDSINDRIDSAYLGNGAGNTLSLLHQEFLEPQINRPSLLGFQRTDHIRGEGLPPSLIDPTAVVRPSTAPASAFEVQRSSSPPMLRAEPRLE